MKITRTLILGFVSLFATFPLKAEKLQTGTEAIAEGNNKFAIDLYSKLKSEDGNVFFSPYSISTAIGMTYPGAENETEKQIAKVFHFTEGQKETCKSFGMLQSHLNNIQKKENIKLAIANVIWTQEGVKFLQNYLDLLKKDFQSEINHADFRDPGNCEKARQEINSLVEKKTQGKIKETIPKGALNNKIMVLVNAIYFKGDWQIKFNEKYTNKDGVFFPSPDKKITVPMMYQSKSFKYGEDESTMALELPYKGKETSMLILLPKEKDGIQALEKSLTYDYLQKLQKRMSKRKVDVLLPKFKIENEFELSKTLSGMGMKDAFLSSDADFSGMLGKEGLYISKAFHKAFVEVDENGTEAAATSVVTKTFQSARARPVFKADHPFIFIIRENSTGTILFMGRMSNPEK